MSAKGYTCKSEVGSPALRGSILRGLIHRTLLLLLPAVLLLPSTLAAQSASTGIIQGKIVDAADGRPMAAVNITVEGTPYGTLTNAEGFYILRNIPAGEHTLRFSFVGYRPLRIERISVLPSLRTTVDVRLEQTAIDLPPIVITADRALIQKDVTGTMHRIGSVAIQRLPVDRFQEIVELQPGVVSGGHIRGGRASETLYVLDGVPAQDPSTGGVALEVPRAAITELNVYTGGFDAEFGNALSGVVHVITRRGGNRFRGSLRFDRDDLGRLFGGSEHSGRAQVEAVVGGPIRRDRAFYLLAFDRTASDTRWWQDFEKAGLDGPFEQNWSLFGRSDLYLSPTMRLTGEMVGSHRWERGYEWRWRFNLKGLPASWRDGNRLSMTFNHMISPLVFYDLQFSTLRIQRGVNEKRRSALMGAPLWSYDAFLQYVEDGNRLWWFRGDQRINTSRGNITAQVGAHRLKAGFDLTFHQLESDLLKLEPRTTYYGMPVPGEAPLDYSSSYRYFPRTGAFYLQDTFESDDGLVIKAGLRYDWLDPRARRPLIEWVPTTSEEFEQQVTGWVPASRKALLSPRVGLAFPLDLSTYFLFNYGQFFQVPLFDQLYSGLNVDLTRGLRVLVGNPDLEHQRTKAYEFAFRRAFDSSSVGSFTYFYKESFNLIDTKTFTAGDSRALEDGFTQFVNLPLSRSSGVEVAFERRRSEGLGYRVAYTYMVARGHADTELSGLNYLQWGFEPPRRMYYLSWDQRHTITAESMGRFAGMDVNLIGRFNSARPYTYAPSATGVLPEGTTVFPNNARMRDVMQLDVRIGREWRFGPGGRKYILRLYGDVRNLTDRANVEWVSSNGRIGGELGDPGAYRIGRRTRIGLEIQF